MLCVQGMQTKLRRATRPAYGQSVQPAIPPAANDSLQAQPPPLRPLQQQPAGSCSGAASAGRLHPHSSTALGRPAAPGAVQPGARAPLHPSGCDRLPAAPCIRQKAAGEDASCCQLLGQQARWRHLHNAVAVPHLPAFTCSTSPGKRANMHPLLTRTGKAPPIAASCRASGAGTRPDSSSSTQCVLPSAANRCSRLVQEACTRAKSASWRLASGAAAPVAAGGVPACPGCLVAVSLPCSVWCANSRLSLLATEPQ